MTTELDRLLELDRLRTENSETGLWDKWTDEKLAEYKSLKSQIESKFKDVDIFPELINVFKNGEGEIIKIIIKEGDKFKELNINFGYPIPTNEITLENHLKKESKLAQAEEYQKIGIENTRFGIYNNDYVNELRKKEQELSQLREHECPELQCPLCDGDLIVDDCVEHCVYCNSNLKHKFVLEDKSLRPIVQALKDTIPEQTKVINTLRRALNNIEKSELIRVELSEALSLLKHQQSILTSSDKNVSSGDKK